MNTEDKNNNILNQVSSLAGSSPDFTKLYVAAGAAVVGGALYYYLNNSVKPKRIPGFDYNNQTTEIQVRFFLKCIKFKLL